jgi:hypothetical protein
VEGDVGVGFEPVVVLLVGAVVVEDDVYLPIAQGLEPAVAPRAGNYQQWRTIGALNALTGQVTYLDGYIVGRRQVMQFYAQLDHAYPAAELLYVIQDNWNIHTPPRGAGGVGALSPHPTGVVADLCPMAQSD